MTLLAGPQPGWSWGCEGHEIIAQIAQRHLTAQARGAVRALLGPTPIDPRLRRFCPPVQDGLLAQVSTWADDVRRDERSPFFGTGSWHFINLPRGRSSGDGSAHCPGRRGCITSALEQELGVLRDLGAERKRRAEALMMVVHLIGDLHQPLHCATNNDAGGNCVPVAYFHTEPRLSGERADSGVYQPNLHSIWDTSIIRHIMARRSTRSVADLLEKRFGHRIASWEDTGVDIRAWAFETHAVAERTAYGQLPVPLPIAAPHHSTQCRERSKQLAALHEYVGGRYAAAVRPAIEEQLMKAGVRLALVLNQIRN